MNRSKMKRKPMLRAKPRASSRKVGHVEGGGGLVARLLARWEQGICITCDERIASAEQVGQSMFAKPCGHRIGMGSAAAYNAGMKRTG